MTEHGFRIRSLNISEKKGTRKHPVESITLVAGVGVAGDAHAGELEDRQVSLLAFEDITASNEILSARREGGCLADDATGALVPGDFAENITTEGVELAALPVGTRLTLGTAVLEISRIGKSCHAACEIRRLVGDCIMPRRGVFARVVVGGTITHEDHCHYRIG